MLYHIVVVRVGTRRSRNAKPGVFATSVNMQTSDPHDILFPHRRRGLYFRQYSQIFIFRPFVITEPKHGPLPNGNMDKNGHRVRLRLHIPTMHTLTFLQRRSNVHRWPSTDILRLSIRGGALHGTCHPCALHGIVDLTPNTSATTPSSNAAALRIAASARRTSTPSSRA